MKTHRNFAFTLIELLVVITIIGILAGIALPVYNSVQLSGKKTQSLNNLRQLTTAALSYAGDNDGSLPSGNTKTPVWSTPVSAGDWYNVLPRTYMSSPNLNEYATHAADFYKKGSVFYTPAAKYPADSVKLATPQWSVAFNSKLFTKTVLNVRLQGLTLPAETVLFLETGCAGETAVKGQSAYSSATQSPYCYASRAIARYNSSLILTFADGHADVLQASSVVDPSTGKAYFVAYPGAFPTGAAKIYWELDPTVSPNS